MTYRSGRRRLGGRVRDATRASARSGGDDRRDGVRRLGIGRDAAQLIFNRFAGSWEITEFLHNKTAVSFWRAILTEYTQGKFLEKTTHGEVRQTFTSGNRQRPR